MGDHWIGLLFCCCWQLCLAPAPAPQIANPNFATNNPTLTTIALEKPFCIFDDFISKGTAYEVYLYVMVDSADHSRVSVMDNSGKPLNATFQQTNGGRSGPYKAATLNFPDCASPLKLDAISDAAKAPAVLAQYLIRVGDDDICLHDPDFLDVCNPPLSEDTAYRFKYIFVDQTVGVTRDETLWSRPIKTKKLIPFSSIAIWPGQRSSTTIVISAILSVLTFVLLLGFLAALLLAVSRTEIPTETRYASQIIQHTAPRAEERL